MNIIPDATLHAFEEDATIARMLDADPDATSKVFGDLESVGIDLAHVAETLESEGVASFAKAFNDVLGVLRDKTES